MADDRAVDRRWDSIDPIHDPQFRDKWVQEAGTAVLTLTTPSGRWNLRRQGRLKFVITMRRMFKEAMGLEFTYEEMDRIYDVVLAYIEQKESHLDVIHEALYNRRHEDPTPASAPPEPSDIILTDNYQGTQGWKPGGGMH